MNEEAEKNTTTSFLPMPNRKKLSYLFALFAASLGLSSLSDTVLSISVLAILFIFVTAKARSVYPMVVTLSLTVISVIFASVVKNTWEMFLPEWALYPILRNSFGLGCAFLSLTVGICTLAGLLKTGSSGWLAVLLPFAGFGIGSLTASPAEAFPALAILPAGILLAFKIGKGQKRSEAVTAVLLGLAAFLTGAVLVAAYLSFGHIHRDDILSSVSGLRDSFTDVLIRMRDRYFEMLDGMATSDTLTETVTKLRSSFSDSVLATMVEAVFNVLPGLALMICGIVAYVSQLLLQAVSIADGRDELFPTESRVFLMGAPSGVIFLISFLVSFFATSTNLFVAVCDNLILILTPAFVIVGMQIVAFRLFHSNRAAKGVWVILLAICFCCMFETFLYVVAFVGAIETILIPVRKKMMERSQNFDGSDRKG